LKIEAEASEIFGLAGESMVDEYVLKNNRLAFNNIVLIEEICVFCDVLDINIQFNNSQMV